MADPSFEVRVDPAVHAAHPDYVALVLLASGLANGPSDAGSDAQLAAAEAHLRASVLGRATDHPHIAAWRAAFSPFGAKPSRYPSSTEALITRVLKGQALPHIDALADLYSSRTTPRAFFVFDRLDGLTVDELHHAADELSDLLLDRWPNCHLDRVERRAT